MDVKFDIKDGVAVIQLDDGKKNAITPDAGDSILAAPIVLDLARLLDLANRKGSGGVQGWLGYYFKSPQPLGDERVEHNLFTQEEILFETIAKLSAG